MLILIATLITNMKVPTDAEIRKRVVADQRELVFITLETEGIVEKVYEKNVWRFYYNRPFCAKIQDPNSRSQKSVIKGAVRYIKVGERYVFNEVLVEKK